MSRNGAAKIKRTNRRLTKIKEPQLRLLMYPLTELLVHLMVR
jgi:hypothetical protein